MLLLLLLLLLIIVVICIIRLIQYYDLIVDILYVLDAYSKNLQNMTSGYLTTDNPEVLMFHKNNMEHYRIIIDIINSVTFFKKKEREKLPLPDME